MTEMWLWKLGKGNRRFSLLVLKEWTSCRKCRWYKILESPSTCLGCMSKLMLCTSRPLNSIFSAHGVYRNPCGPEWRPPTGTHLSNSSCYWPFMTASWARNSGLGVEIDKSMLLQRSCPMRYKRLQSLEDVWRNSFTSVSIGKVLSWNTACC